MIDTLAIKWEDSGKSPPNSVANGIKKIIEKRLSKFGYRGIWRVTPIQKQRSAACDDGFKYRCLGEVATQPCLKAFCRPKDRESCWEVAIYPPADYDIGDVDINLSGNKPKPKTKTKPKKTTEKSSHNLVVGQVLKVDITGKAKYGLRVCVPSIGLQGLVPIEHLGTEYDADNLNAYRVGNSLKVQVIELEPKVKFSPEGAKHATETDSVDDIFNGSSDPDGMLRLKGYSASIERSRELFLWLDGLARNYYPDPIPRNKAIDEVYLNLIEKYNATQAPRKSVAILVQAVKHKGWIYVTGGRDFGITDDGWIELGGSPDDGPSPAATTIIIQEPEVEELEEVEEPEVEVEEIEVEEVEVEETTSGTASLAKWVHKIDRMLSINAAMEELQAEKAEIEGWLSAHHDEINSIAKQLG